MSRQFCTQEALVRIAMQTLLSQQELDRVFKEPVINPLNSHLQRVIRGIY